MQTSSSEIRVLYPSLNAALSAAFFLPAKKSQFGCSCNKLTDASISDISINAFYKCVSSFPYCHLEGYEDNIYVSAFFLGAVFVIKELELSICIAKRGTESDEWYYK